MDVILEHTSDAGPGNMVGEIIHGKLAVVESVPSAHSRFKPHTPWPVSGYSI